MYDIMFYFLWKTSVNLDLLVGAKLFYDKNIIVTCHRRATLMFVLCSIIGVFFTCCSSVTVFCVALFYCFLNVLPLVLVVLLLMLNCSTARSSFSFWRVPTLSIHFHVPSIWSFSLHFPVPFPFHISSFSPCFPTSFLHSYNLPMKSHFESGSTVSSLAEHSCA